MGDSELWHDFAIAGVAHDRGDHNKALALYEQIQEQAEREDDRELSVLVLLSMGDLYRSQGQTPLAISIYRQGLELAHELYGGEYTAFLLGDQSYEVQGDAQAALEAYQQVLSRLDTALPSVGSQQQRSRLEGGTAWVYESTAALPTRAESGGVFGQRAGTRSRISRVPGRAASDPGCRSRGYADRFKRARHGQDR